MALIMVFFDKDNLSDGLMISVVCPKEFLITYKPNVNESSEFYSWIHILS